MTYYAIVQNNEVVYVGRYISIAMKKALELIWKYADLSTLREEYSENSFIMRAHDENENEIVLNICELSPTHFIDML